MEARAARLYEHQGKESLRRHRIAAPKGRVVSTPEQAHEAASGFSGGTVVKAMAWTTGRAGLGAIPFAATPEETAAAARSILGLRIGNFLVESVLVEERLAIEKEFYAGVIVDDGARAPVAIFSSKGGTGVEEIAREHPGSIARIP